MSALILTAPITFPSSTPLIITVMVPHILLHYFDASLDKNPSMTKWMTEKDHLVSRELVQRAIYTCLGPVTITPRLREGCSGEPGSDLWSLVVQIECSVSGDEEDLSVVYFEAKQELNEDGNVQFTALVPQTTKAKARYNVFNL
jgi:hypothetical protein